MSIISEPNEYNWCIVYECIEQKFGKEGPLKKPNYIPLKIKGKKEKLPKILHCSYNINIFILMLAI